MFTLHGLPVRWRLPAPNAKGCEHKVGGENMVNKFTILITDTSIIIVENILVLINLLFAKFAREVLPYLDFLFKIKELI